MGAVYFYHLTRTPLDAVLPMLLERSLQAGWRVMLRGVSLDRMAELDEQLWLGADSFLPHGLAGGAPDRDQPVLLGLGAAANGALCLMLVDGAALNTDEAAAMQRTCVIFDGGDDGAVAGARLQWKQATDAGLPAQYWSEESGGWVKKTER